MSFDHRCTEPAAIHTQLGAIFVSLELSRKTWLVSSVSPQSGSKMSKHSVTGGDMAGLLARFEDLRSKARAPTGKVYPIIVIQEAGLDGFWIHRVLEAEGIESHVVDPASIATSRRRRRVNGQDRWRCAGARIAGLQARRTAGVLDGPPADA